jgi:hypothetical protein
VEATHIQPTEPRINKTQIPRGQNTAAEGFFTCTAHGQPIQTDNFNDILNGVTYTRDPTNGAHREVPTGTGGTHWMNGNNVVVESSLSPGPGFHQFENVSR